MAITRRQFVTRLGALAAATGMGQADLAKITQAFAHGNTLWANKKPKVVWVHGAECTGCSTSLLGLFENAGGLAVEDTRLTDPFALGGVTTGAALGLIGDLDGDALGATGTATPHGHRTITKTRAITGVDFDGVANADTETIVNIADVLIDFIDLQYHETVMGSGGDLAYQWLADNMYNGSKDPFVLVVEGAVQANDKTAAWAGETSGAPWCSIGMDANAHGTPVAYTGQTHPGELPFDEVVTLLAKQATGIIAIGQCACYGGYPAAVSPFYGDKQTPAFGVYDFLAQSALTDVSPTFFKSKAMSKVINVPGCPTNPWWFVLTTVLFLVDAVNGPFAATPAAGPLGILDINGIPKASAIDYGRRLKHVYGTPVHGPACPRYKSFTAGVFAENPGGEGCLLNLGCKGPATNSLCSLHGWNGRQPRNTATWDHNVAADQGNKRGGFCVTAGHPCMGCTEKGYPDSYVPFVNR